LKRFNISVDFETGTKQEISNQAGRLEK
jgi:hypothetical protein